MDTEPQQEHQWLHKLVGEWTHASEASSGPDQPPEKLKRDGERALAWRALGAG